MFDWEKLDVRFLRASVAVPEFDTSPPAPSSDSGEGDKPPFEMVVRELTADEKRDLSRGAQRAGEYLFYDIAQAAYFGSVTGDVDETGIGTRAFPSAEFLRRLPANRYGDAIGRLANETLMLSGMIKRAGAGTLETEKNA